MMILNKKKYRKNFCKLYKDELVDKKIVTSVMSLLKRLPYDNVGIYYPMDHEVKILSLLNVSDKFFSLPVIFENNIRFCRYEYNTILCEGKYGIQIPKFIEYAYPEILIIPGKAFDFSGSRIGSGKGFYDNFLQNNKINVTIGVCYNHQLHVYIQQSICDKKMNYVITEESIICT